MADFVNDKTLDNLTELLSNTVNMTSVFYDIFLNPQPMDVTLQQYDTQGNIVTISIPNRAKDRQIALSGEGSPEGVVSANIGASYVDETNLAVYFKATGDGTNVGWVIVSDQSSINAFMRNYLESNGYVTKDDIGRFLESDLNNALQQIDTARVGAIKGVDKKGIDTIIEVENEGDTQVQRVTTAGAEQVSLATAQVDRATAQVDRATAQADRAKSEADNAEHWVTKLYPDTLNLSKMYMTDKVFQDDQAFEQLKAMKHSTFDLSKFTVVGSPTITNDGIFVNTKVVDSFPRIVLNKSFSECNSWEIITPKMKILNLTTSTERHYLTSKDFSLLIRFTYTNGRFYVKIKPSETSNQFTLSAQHGTLSLNDLIQIKITYENGLYKIYSKLNDGNWVFGNQEQGDNLDTLTALDVCNYGNTYVVKDELEFDLKYTSIVQDGVEVFNGNKTGIDTIKPDNYEVVGSPVISEDGVASGFSANDYIKTGLPSKTVVNTEINMLFKMGSLDDVQILCAALSSFRFQISYDNGNMILFFGNGKVWQVSISGWLSPSPNTEYLVKIVTSASEIKIYVNGTLTKTVPQTNFSYDLSYIGVIGSRTYATILPFNGSFDLNAFKIYVDGNLVYQPCLKIPYTESKTGSKIVDEVYRDRVIDLYEQQGQAGYYTIDEENKNFTLPMGEIYGMIEGNTKLIKNNTKLLNGKLDVSNIKRYPVEVSDKSLMPSWYVVYSDGWCEQGGVMPNSYGITLLKTYKDINYTAIATQQGSADVAAGIYMEDKSTSFFKMTTIKTDRAFYWETSGYLAEGEY